MPKQVKISVILTSYNKSYYIGKAIKSILNQTYQDFEIIIVDDGSNDDSKKIITQAAEQDSRIRTFFFERNEGIPSAHNYAISMAQGEYCAMIDCDDFWEKEKLEKQVQFLQKNKEYGACFTWIRVVDENEIKVSSEKCENRDIMWNSQNHSQGEWLRIFFSEGCKLGNPSMMVRKSVLDEIGSYAYGLKQLQDYDLFIRILKKYNVYILNEKLVNYRWFRGEVKNTSFDNLETASRSNFEYYLICKEFFTNLDLNIFKEGFEKYFRQNCTSEEELICEQIFISKEYFLMPLIGRAVAMENIYLLLNNKQFYKILHEKYGITSTLFAEQIKAPIFLDEKYYISKDGNKYADKMDKKLKEAKKQWYKSVEYNKELENGNRELENINKKKQNYISELENGHRELENVNKKMQNYISELEKKNNYISKVEQENEKVRLEQRKYIEELEIKTKEMSGLYIKCNEYALSLENRVREQETLLISINGEECKCKKKDY